MISPFLPFIIFNGMKSERNPEKSALDWRLSSALISWQKWPDSKEHMTKMQQTIDAILKDTKLVMMVRKENLGNWNRDESFIFPGVEKAYGHEEGCLVEFDTLKGIELKVGEIKTRGYLFLKKGNQRLGYLRPGLVVKIAVK